MNQVIQLWPIIVFVAVMLGAMFGFWWQTQNIIKKFDPPDGEFVKMKEQVDKHDREISGLCGRMKPQVNRGEL